ncbi:MAG: hypothetical protein K2I64_05590 [Muribaculaceae bacterium]|nr:hypothetical protein [Muribaculaceae bacterium]
MITAPFSVAPAAHARVALRLYAGRWWPLVVLPPLACIVASVANPAFLIAALIWILLLLPPAVMAVYFSILLRPSVAVMTRPHTVEFGIDAIEVLFPTEETDDKDDQPSLRQLPPVSIPYTSIVSIQEVAEYIAVVYRLKGRRTILLLPVSLLSLSALDRLSRI